MLGILPRLKRLIAAVGLAVGLLAAAYLRGKAVQRDDHRVEDLESYIKTKETIDEVDASPDSDAAFERLRDNGWLR